MMEGPLRESAIRAWETAKGGVANPRTAPPKHAQYAPLYCLVRIELTYM
jgi:hypothetical protein